MLETGLSRTRGGLGNAQATLLTPALATALLTNLNFARPEVRNIDDTPRY